MTADNMPPLSFKDALTIEQMAWCKAYARAYAEQQTAELREIIGFQDTIAASHCTTIKELRAEVVRLNTELHNLHLSIGKS